MSEQAGFGGDAGMEQGGVAEVREPSAKYLVQMDYQPSEIGPIPSDWGLSTVGVEFSVRLGKMLDADRNVGVHKPYLGNKAVQWGKVDVSEVQTMRMSKADLDKFRLQPGDLLVCEGGEVGRAAIWDAPFDECYYQKALHRLRPLRGYEPRMMLAVLQLWASRGMLSNYVTQTSIAHLPKEKFVAVPIPLPAPEEQRAIATALSDVDALIAGLQRLIAKKRDIKQAAMQQLLTGQTRLPGFSGEWRECSLGQIAHIKTGSRNNEDKVEDGRYPFFVRSANVERINTYSHECEAILVPGEGQIGSIFHYINGRFDVHQRVYAITQFGDDISGRFVHLFMSQHFGAWAMQNTVKATVDSLRLPTFQTFMMRMPPSLEEQTAIATALTDMDADLAAIESRLAKTRAIKQGMMQELLTGRTRLV
jgi:type I restriction enzyme S subunit